MVVVVVDATALSRSLTLLAQVLQLGVDCVLCLNMSDEAERAGQHLDTDRMARLLNIPVVQTVGHKGIGETELRTVLAQQGKRPGSPHRLDLGSQLGAAISAVKEALVAAGFEAQ